MRFLPDEQRDALGNSWDDGICIALSDGSEVRLAFADLASPPRLRAAFYAQIGHAIPHYDDEQHAEIVRVVMALAGMRPA